MNLEQLIVEYRSKQRAVDRRAGEARQIAEQGKLASQAVRDLELKHDVLEKSIGVLRSFGEQRQAELQEKVENLVTYGLRSIFGPEISFHIRPVQRGKLMAMDFVVRQSQNGQITETGVMDARGGGVAVVAGFLLRLIVLLLSKERADPVLLLDETFAQLSEEFEPKLAEFIRELVDKTDVQIILVTHSPLYSDYADKVYSFRKVAGETQVEEKSSR